MTKSTGLGQELYLDGIHISSDIGSGTISGGMAVVLPMTGINKLAYERGGGGRTGSMQFQTWFNPAVLAPVGAHSVVSTFPTTDRMATYVHRPVLGGSAVNMVCKQVDYAMTREANANLFAPFSALSNGYGQEWTQLITNGEENFTGAAAGDGWDSTVVAATDFGLQAYMQVTSFTGTSATVTIEDSDDDGVGDAYAAVTGAAFAAASAIGTQRIQTSRTENVKRWLRVNITGTFSDLTIVVGVAKNLTAVNF